MRVLSADSGGPTAVAACRTLQPIAALLSEFELQSIRYCHWKGNASLEQALRGDKDLDLLVDRNAADRVVAIVARAGFRRLSDSPGSGFPGVEHHLALDETEGRFAHLHLHWQLVPTKANESFVRLPWEELVLSTRVQHEWCEVQVPAPEVELLLFFVRQALRVRAKHFVAERLGRPFMTESMRSELHWLTERATAGAVQRRAISLIGDHAARMTGSLMRGMPTARMFREFRDAIRPSLQRYRGRRRLDVIKGSVQGRARGSRTLPAGGRIIAFLGSDGAGKSTVVRAITAWLGTQLDVRQLYLGSGDGERSLIRASLCALDAARRLVVPRRRRHKLPLEQPTAAYLDGSSYVKGVEPGMRALWKLTSKVALAREKTERLSRAWRWRTQGVVVICDRYPQTRQAGFNDGPQLTPWISHRSPLLRAAAQRELDAYRLADTLHPDVVIKLMVSSETAASRKGDMSVDLLHARAASIRALGFPEATRVVEVDADQPLDHVLANVRRIVWGCL